MNLDEKPLVWLHGEIQTPPFSTNARLEAGFLLRKLQKGETLSLPHSRPMPSIGSRVHELRISDKNNTWRIICRIDMDVIVILEVFAKKSRTIPKRVTKTYQDRLKRYDKLSRGKN